jgi:pimeloyl-ACP methyl ester carboxylesterase
MKAWASKRPAPRALIGVAAVLGTAVVARADAGVTGSAHPQIDWVPCADAPGLDCGHLPVPLDYSHPDLGQVQIALVRVPATDAAQRIGSIFVNPGGPGGSGVDLVRGAFGPQLATLLGGRFDVIGFDPRGVGGSDALHCFSDLAAEASYLDGLPAFPYRTDQERPFFDRFAGLADICAAGGQAIFSHMSTADVARDLDLLRSAVGDDQLTYLGFSYGTFLGETYANLFPDRVRALVIDGVLDPRRWTSGLQISSEATSLQAEFEEFLRLCDAAGSACAFSAPEGALARYRALAARLELGPIVLPDAGLLSYDGLISGIFSALYVPERWGGPAGFAAQLAAASEITFGRLRAGESALTLSQAVQRLQNGGATSSPGFAISFDSEQGTICADADFPTAFEDFRATAAATRAPSLALPFWWPEAACSAWPSAASRYAGPWTHTTAAPVLIVGNYFDGITAYADAVATSQLLPNSRLLSYAGWGHTAFGRSVCVQRYVAQYLLDGQLPPEGSVCPIEADPFAAPGASADSAPASAARIPSVGLPPPRFGR